MPYAAIPCGLGFLGLWINELRKGRYLSVDDGKLWLQRARGAKKFPKSVVAFVDDDLIQFHLYAKKERVSISKRQLPADWVAELERHRDAFAKGATGIGVFP